MELAGKYAGLNSLRDSGMTIHQGIEQALSVLKKPQASERQQTQAMIDLSEFQNILRDINQYDAQHYPGIPLNKLISIPNQIK